MVRPIGTEFVEVFWRRVDWQARSPLKITVRLRVVGHRKEPDHGLSEVLEVVEVTPPQYRSIIRPEEYK